MEAPKRIVALGASNLTRGFHTVVATARQLWGPEIEVLAALGHGRSYAMPSTVLARTLPGILQCGLWRQIERMPPLPTRSLITDVGNDILYGASVAQILGWVEEAIIRLQRLAPDIILTDLPLARSTSARAFGRAPGVRSCAANPARSPPTPGPCSRPCSSTFFPPSADGSPVWSG